MHVRSDRKNIRRRVRYLQLRLRFEADPLKLPMHDPCIVSWEAVMRGSVYIHPSEVKYSEENETKYSLAAKKDKVPVEGGWDRTNKKGKEFARADKATCSSTGSGTETRGGGRKGRDVVGWTLRENKSQELLPDSFGTAVVITRSDGLNFRVVYDVHVDIDFWDGVATAFHRVKDVLSFRGRRELGKTYDVSKESKVPEGVVKARLGDLVDKDGLGDFTFFHEPEEVESTKFYGKKK